MYSQSLTTTQTAMINTPFYSLGSVARGLMILTVVQTEIMGQGNSRWDLLCFQDGLVPLHKCFQTSSLWVPEEPSEEPAISVLWMEIETKVRPTELAVRIQKLAVWPLNVYLSSVILLLSTGLRHPPLCSLTFLLFHYRQHLGGEMRSVCHIQNAHVSGI